MDIYKDLKLRVFEIIQKGRKDDRASIIFDYFIIFLIVLNVLAIILESFENIYYLYKDHLCVFEIFSVVIFTIEYILRIWTAELNYQHKNRFNSIMKFILSPLALIDLLAIVPFYLPMIISFDLRFLRMLRLTRLLRVFKLNRYSTALNLVSKVLKEKKEEILVTVFITFILILVASTLMYYLEHDIQPEAFPNIIASFWWGIATLTTVGYGDVYPVTGLGRLLSGVIAVLGIGLVALPTGILSSGFLEEISIKARNSSEEENPTFCPYCGKQIKK